MLHRFFSSLINSKRQPGRKELPERQQPEQAPAGPGICRSQTGEQSGGPERTAGARPENSRAKIAGTGNKRQRVKPVEPGPEISITRTCFLVPANREALAGAKRQPENFAGCQSKHQPENLPGRNRSISGHWSGPGNNRWSEEQPGGNLPGRSKHQPEPVTSESERNRSEGGSNAQCLGQHNRVPFVNLQNTGLNSQGLTVSSKALTAKL